MDAFSVSNRWLFLIDEPLLRRALFGAYCYVGRARGRLESVATEALRSHAASSTHSLLACLLLDIASYRGVRDGVRRHQCSTSTSSSTNIVQKFRCRQHKIHLAIRDTVAVQFSIFYGQREFILISYFLFFVRISHETRLSVTTGTFYRSPPAVQ